MEKLAGDLLLGLKFVKLEILSTSFIDFLYNKLGELRLRSLGLKGLKRTRKSNRYFHHNHTKTADFKNVSSCFVCFLVKQIIGINSGFQVY